MKKDIQVTPLSGGKLKMLVNLGNGATVICLCYPSEAERYYSIMESIKKMSVDVGASTDGDSSLNVDVTKVESGSYSDLSLSYPSMTAVKKAAKDMKGQHHGY